MWKALLSHVDSFGGGTYSFPLAAERRRLRPLIVEFCGIDPSCFWCYVMQALVDVDAEFELDALWNVEPVQLIKEYPRQPPVALQ